MFHVFRSRVGLVRSSYLKTSSDLIRIHRSAIRDRNRCSFSSLQTGAVHGASINMELSFQIRFNDPDQNPPLFTTGVIGKDNTIARHGIHGLYWSYTIDVPGTELAFGENTIFLMQTMSRSPFQGVMYDYIRFEGPTHSRPDHRG